MLEQEASTAGGFSALRLAESQEGDTVALVEGRKVSQALRQKREHFRLVDDCHVNGAMHGEAFRKGQSKAVRIL